MRRISLIVATWALATAVIAAADVWEEKPYTQWSDKDLQKVLTDSPWAGKASLTHARQGANLGSVPDWKLIVTMRSAIPIKQGLIREVIGAGGMPTAEHEAMLAAPEGLYVISISGIPRQFTTQLGNVASATYVKRKDKEPLTPVQATAMLFDKDGNPVETPQASAPAAEIVRVQRGGGGRGGVGGGGQDDGVTATLLLGFPKDDAITEDDKEFEVITVIGAYNVKRTFKLKDMVFNGALAM
jgi:hypothetical protein